MCARVIVHNCRTQDILMISPHILQTINIARIMSTGGEEGGGKQRCSSMSGTNTDIEILVAAWRSGNIVARINEVTLRRAQLVLGWVTVFGGQTTSVFHQAT